MANTRSAEKKNRQDVKRTAHNRAQRSRLKTAIKSVGAAADSAGAEQALKAASALLDRMASRHIIHPNKAARKKSQLARQAREMAETA